MSQSSSISRLSSPPESLFQPSSDEPSEAQAAPRSSKKGQSKRPILEQLIEMEEQAAAAAAAAAAASPKEEPPSSVPTKRKAADQGCKPSASKAPRRSVSGAEKSTSAKPKARKSKIPSLLFALTDPKSPLAKADIRAILMHPLAWSSLTVSEKREILSLFPDASKNVLDAGTDQARPNLQRLSNDDNYRNDCARYAENLGLGRHDPEWLQQAWVAHERHRAGDFDEYLEKEFESTWGEGYPVEHRPLRSGKGSEGAGGKGEGEGGQDGMAMEVDSPGTTAPRSDLENLTLVSTASPASMAADAELGTPELVVDEGVDGADEA